MDDNSEQPENDTSPIQDQPTDPEDSVVQYMTNHQGSEIGSGQSVIGDELEIVNLSVEDISETNVSDVDVHLTEFDAPESSAAEIERQAFEAKAQQNWALAVDLWSHLICEFDTRISWFLELAIAQRENGQSQESLVTLEQAESQYGLDCWIADNRARAYLALGENRMAKEHWRIAMEHSTSHDVRESFERMLHDASEARRTTIEGADTEQACETGIIYEKTEQQEVSRPMDLVKLDNGVTLECGIIDSRLWMLATGPVDDAVLEFAPNHIGGEATIQWYARPESFIYQTLQNINLLPNPDFRREDGKSLEGWLQDATESCAVDVDFSDHFKLRDGHTAYLYAPAGAPRPGLCLQEPIAILGDMGFSYRFIAFISVHRANGEVVAEFLDVDGNLQVSETLNVYQTDRHPGGTQLSDYRWIEWLICPPKNARFVNFRICLGEHNGQYPEDSFLFLTLPFFGIASEKPQAWGPAYPSASDLLNTIQDARWNRYGAIDIPAGVRMVRIKDQSFDIEGSLPPLDLMDRKQALLGALQISGGGPIWVACRWPVSGDFHVTYLNGQTTASVSGLLSPQEFLKGALLGQNLLPNSDFSEGLAHWQPIPDAGVDFAPNVKPSGGHAAYIFRKAGAETDATRLYMESLPLPAGISTVQLSGLFGYHRCLGHLGIEWLDGLGVSLGELLLQPKKSTARGEQRLSNYDVQEAQIMVPDKAIAFRIFVEKTMTLSGHKDSFLFFTRLLVASADGGRLKWRRFDPVALERAMQFGKLANYYQRLDGEFHSRYISKILLEDGEGLVIQGPEVVEAHSSDVKHRERGVFNGNFESWEHGLTQVSDKEEFPAADGWHVHNPGLVTIRVMATRLRTRDPWLGIPGDYAHGLEIDYAEAVESVALVGELVTGGLLPRRGAILRLYLSTGDMGNYGCVDAVDLLLGDERVINLANRVQFGSAGRYFEFRITVTDAEQLQSSGLSAHLRLNLGVSSHCIVADVSLTSVADEKPRCDSPPAVLGLEDPNLDSQSERIKLTENWGRSSIFECVSRYAPLSGQPRVEILIPVHNALQETLACLHSIRVNTTVPYALTVIDDASEPDVTQALRAYQQRNPGLTLLHNETNLGYTRTANLGFAHARAEWVVLLNSDTIVTPGWLEGLLECAESDPDIKFVGPLSNAATWQSVPAVFDVMGKFKVNCLPSGYTAADMARLVEAFSRRAYPRVKLLNGFCTLIHRQTVMELGLLDEMAFPQGYGEENDLCLRAAEAGYQLAIADHVYVYHAKSASFGPVRRNTLSKAGSDALRRKHPAVDLARVQADIAESPSLIQLRQDLRTHLGGNP